MGLQRENPPIRPVPYIYRGLFLRVGFSEIRNPNIPLALRQSGRCLRFSIFGADVGRVPAQREPVRHQGDGGMPLHANAITDLEGVGDMVADHRSKTVAELCHLELAETRFPKPG